MMLIKIILILATFLFVQINCDSQNVYFIEGRVDNLKEPLSAPSYVYISDSEKRERMQLDKRGYFKFENLGEGLYTLRFEFNTNERLNNLIIFNIDLLTNITLEEIRSDLISLFYRNKLNYAIEIHDSRDDTVQFGSLKGTGMMSEISNDQLVKHNFWNYSNGSSVVRKDLYNNGKPLSTVQYYEDNTLKQINIMNCCSYSFYSDGQLKEAIQEFDDLDSYELYFSDGSIKYEYIHYPSIKLIEINYMYLKQIMNDNIHLIKWIHRNESTSDSR